MGDPVWELVMESRVHSDWKFEARAHSPEDLLKMLEMVELFPDYMRITCRRSASELYAEDINHLSYEHFEKGIQEGCMIKWEIGGAEAYEFIPCNIGDIYCEVAGLVRSGIKKIAVFGPDNHLPHDF
jgi:hypothetical protein